MIEEMNALIDNGTWYLGLGTWFVYLMGRKPLVAIRFLQ